METNDEMSGMQRRHPGDQRAPGLEIDYCPECRGELDKLIERAERSTGERPRGGDPGRHERRYRDDSNYRYKPRKSLLRELFD